jgi:hypothetical protein
MHSCIRVLRWCSSHASKILGVPVAGSVSPRQCQQLLLRPRVRQRLLTNGEPQDGAVHAQSATRNQTVTPLQHLHRHRRHQHE